MEEPEVSLSNALRRLIQKRFTEKVAEKSNDTKSEPGGGKAGDKSEKQPTSLLASARLNRENQEPRKVESEREKMQEAPIDLDVRSVSGSSFSSYDQWEDSVTHDSSDDSSSSEGTGNYTSSRVPSKGLPTVTSTSYFDETEQSSIPSDIQCLNSELENEILLHRSVSQAAYDDFTEPDQEDRDHIGAFPEAFSRTLQFEPAPMVKIGNPKPLRRHESFLSEQPSMAVSLEPSFVEEQFEMSMPRVPKYAPPPIPMPHSERTIYVHVENEQPVLKAGQDPPKLIEIQGKTVMISSLAQKEIENAAKQIEPTKLTTEEQVPLPLPPGGELAAIWSANLGQPLGSVKKFEDTLAESYTKITNEEVSKPESRKLSHELSGDQLLNLLDLPNLKTSEVGGQKKKRRRRRRVEVKPITIEVDRLHNETDKKDEKINDEQPMTRVVEFQPFKKV